MPNRINRKDLKLLESVAEYRILPIHQLAIIHDRRVRPLRRRLILLEGQDLVKSSPQTLGKKRGRPERLISLSTGGVRLLNEEKMLDPDLPPDLVMAENIKDLEHHLFTNTFRIQLIQLQRDIPSMIMRYISPASPFQICSTNGSPLIQERFSSGDGDTLKVDFIPDGVFSITDQSQKKTLLFFLEVDMATETLASPMNRMNDLRHKVLNYQTLFSKGRYKRYETIFKSPLKGFRLLFLTYTSQRMDSICRLVQDMPPSDFIWVTDRSRCLSQGAWSDIWVVGGRADYPKRSILGSRKPEPSVVPETR